LQLRSFVPYVRPVVTSGLVEIDMTDRVDYYGDVQIPTAGYTLPFAPSFRNVPTVAVTIDGNDQPVVAHITNKNEHSVNISLFNTVSNVAVSGVVDVHAQGYGRRGTSSI
jgi:hypothetical protein